jgi:hypothetical protein
MEDNQEEVEDEYYSDDPVADPKIDWYYKLRSFAPVAILLLVTTVYLPSTVGGRISLQSGTDRVEFGKSVAQTVNCTENSNVLLTPYNSFKNESGIGKNLFGSFKIDQIPTACLGKNITLSVFNNTSSMPLTMFDSDTVPALTATVYISPDNNFYPVNSPSFRVSKNSSTSFTATFDDPVGLSRDVVKMTLQTSFHSDAGLIWNSQNSSAVVADRYFVDVAYGNGVFLAVQDADCGWRQTLYSTDGVNWATRTNAALLTIAFGNGKFFGGCEFNNLMTSSNNGITWIQPARGSSEWPIFFGSAFGKGVYILVGPDIRRENIWRSTNGNIWLPATAQRADLFEVAYGNGTFVGVVACGLGKVTVAGSCGNPSVVGLLSSSDLGLTWTQRTIPIGNWASVTYGNGIFVAVSFAYPYAVAGDTAKRVMTSPDGITWTARTIPDAAVGNGWSDITFGNGLFVAVSNSGSGKRIMTSPDAITWTLQTAAVDNNWNAITYGIGKFVAVSSTGDGNQVMTSG